MSVSDQPVIIAYGAACLLLSVFVLHLCRKNRDSLGFPVAYLFLLMLLHLPGGLAIPFHPVGFSGSRFVVEYTREGLWLTLVGCLSFVGGFMIAQFKARDERPPVLAGEHSRLRYFARYCVVGGWAALFLLAPLRDVPSLGAAIYFGGALWMLGVILGLYNALRLRSVPKILFWLAALAVYPSMVLVFGGFLSFGTISVVIVMCGVLVRISRPKVLVPVALLAGVLGLNLFVNYFLVRDSLRLVLWSESDFSQRLDAIGDAAVNVHWFDGEDAQQMEALTLRLNQNEFVGLAAHRIEQGQVESLGGRSVIEALLSVVPRAIWPGKPVSGGSGDLVVEFTGLDLNQDTSWGVGNVMEFYLNGGVPALVVGFVTLGFLIRWLDIRCYRALVSVEPKRAILYFLPGAALIQPGHSLSEMVGGATAAWVAGLVWVFIWDQFLRPRTAGLPT